MGAAKTLLSYSVRPADQDGFGSTPRCDAGCNLADATRSAGRILIVGPGRLPQRRKTPEVPGEGIGHGGLPDRRRLATDPPLVRRGDRGGHPRRSAPGTVPRRGGWGRVRGAGRAARADGPGHLPVGPPQPRRCRGRLPGHVPGPGLQGTVDPRPGDPRGLAAQVAHRVAVQAGADAVRRRARERRAGLCRAGGLHPNEPSDDWRQVVHEELARLSEKHRMPLLLCDLEGKTHAQAAEELRCGEATVQRRLNDARALLRLPIVPAGDRADGRGPRRDPRPPRDDPCTPGLDRGERPGGRGVRLARRADCGRRHGVHGGRESGTQVVTYHFIESIERGRGRGRRPDRRARDRLASRAGRTAQGRAPSSGRDAGSPSGTRRIPGPGADEPAGGARGHDRLSGPGPRPGRQALRGGFAVPGELWSQAPR